MPYSVESLMKMLCMLLYFVVAVWNFVPEIKSQFVRHFEVRGSITLASKKILVKAVWFLANGTETMS